MAWHFFFDSNNNALCYKGGIQELENDFECIWQNTFSNAKQKSFSRFKLIITLLWSMLKDNDDKCTYDDMLTYFDGWYLNRNDFFQQ